MGLLKVCITLSGYTVTGRHSGRVYFSSTDRALVDAVREALENVKGMTDYEVIVKQARCKHEREVQPRAMDGTWPWICEGCGREREE